MLPLLLKLLFAPWAAASVSPALLTICSVAHVCLNICAHESVHVKNVRDLPQTKLDGELNSPFLLNEHGDPRIFFQVFAKNSLIKNIFEDEKKFDSGTRFFFGKKFPTGCILAKARTSS